MSTDNDISRLRRERDRIDDETNQLIVHRREIVGKIAILQEEQTEMLKKADTVTDIVKYISSLDDPYVALIHTYSRLHPLRHDLPHKYFSKTLLALPECLSPSWNRTQAAEFCACLTQALKEDVAALEATCADE